MMRRNVTAALMGDPDPARLVRSERLRAILPEPRELPPDEQPGLMVSHDADRRLRHDPLKIKDFP